MTDYHQEAEQLENTLEVIWGTRPRVDTIAAALRAAYREALEEVQRAVTNDKKLARMEGARAQVVTICLKLKED